MPDLITIEGEATATDIPTLEILDETAKQLDETNVSVATFADDARERPSDAPSRSTLIKTETQYDADEVEAYGAISCERVR